MRMPADPSAAGLDWNVVVTARAGCLRSVRNALRGLIRLRRGGYRNVMVGQVDDVTAFLAAVGERGESHPHLGNWLSRLSPVERTFAVDPATFDAQLAVEAAPFLDRLAGQSFHVRIERRGHKRIIDTQVSERALGSAVYDTLKARGGAPVVKFADPDAVLVVEMLGDTAGLGLVTREMRTRCPFVKIT